MREIQKPESFHERQRRLLNVPPELDHSPVLYLSSRSGVHYSFESFTDASPQDSTEETSSFVDLSATPASKVINELHQLLSASSDIPPSKVIFNIIFLPGLDQNGESNEPSTTFAIDILNFKVILPKLQEFLSKKLKSTSGDAGIKEISNITTNITTKLLKTNLPE